MTVSRFRHSEEWAGFEGARAKGHAFIGSRSVDAEGIARFLADVQTLPQFVERLAQLEGYFAVVVTSPTQVFAAVDKIRSLPIFYTADSAEPLCGDSAQQLGFGEPDPVSVEEFYLTGFVVGSYSLFTNIRQIQSGEAIAWTRHSSGWTRHSCKYYQFKHGNYLSLSERELLARYDQTMLSVMKRTLKRAGDRQIVVPLSGGYDSRLIALMLRRLGRENVLLYSYGPPGNEESRISQLLARRLGYPWHFVTYSHRAVHQWVRAPEWQRYFNFAHNGVALPLLQDWPANWELQRRGVVSADAVFVPGYSADLLAGSRVRTYPGVCQEAEVTLSDFVDFIFRSHYKLWPWGRAADENREAFSRRILESVGDVSGYEDWASAWDAFNYNERQAKFIVNAIRSYEYWGYSWWLPFFDGEFMEFWAHVPVGYRVGTRLHYKYVDDLCAAVLPGITGEDLAMDDTAHWSPYLRGLAKFERGMEALPLFAKDVFWRKSVRGRWEDLRFRASYATDATGLSGAVSRRSYVQSMKRGAIGLNSILAAHTLGRIQID